MPNPETTDQLEALAVRCEQATGPDREIDEAIADYLFSDKQRHCIAGLSDEEGGMWMWRYPSGSVGTALRYTGADEAAETLVPYDMATIHLRKWWPFGRRRAEIYDGMACVGEGSAKTRRLALIAAALRASKDTSHGR